ncbi:MAG: ABC transporter ATP-binding protein/permease [Lachnospiraceae bacterium]|nr:ABC transporter ATP-binding protein/permease [Lachnospiraceae bacterium]
MNNSKNAFFKLLSYIGRYKILFFLSVVLAGVTVVLQLYVPYLFGDAIDGIIGAGKVDFSHVTFYLVRIGICVGICSVLTWIMNMINNHLTYHVVKDIRAKAIRQLQYLPLSYLDSHSTGDILSRVINDTDQLSDGLLMGLNQLFSGVCMIIVTLIFMLQKSLLITVLVVVLTPLSFLVARFIATHSFDMFTKQSSIRGEQTALIEELVGNGKVVKAFGYENRAVERFDEVNERLKVCATKALFYSSLTNPSTRFVNSLIYAVVALSGAFMIIGGSLTVGGLSVLLSYANQYMKPFNDISSVVTELQNAFACAVRVFELIEEKRESEDPSDVLSDAEGVMEIRDVSFSYDKSKRLIEDFSLNVPKGAHVAIVGPTGCGKTTFINLLMRFYDVDSGEIRIDGKRIDEISRNSLRESFGMVLQDSWIKNDTVRNNINIGKEDATDEEIINACKEAYSWSFIKRLPEGLDTVISDDALSQGEKQLLCITRVMLILPPMLILDEATSSIDTRTEVRIQKAFGKLMEGRTSFIVAHRLSTIRNADIILVMKDGHIIEQGNHESLLAAGGFYSKLYNSQFQ